MDTIKLNSCKEVNLLTSCTKQNTCSFPATQTHLGKRLIFPTSSMAHRSRDNTCEAKLCLAFFPFPLLFCSFLSSKQYNWIVSFTKMLKTCTCLSVKFVFSLTIAYEGPDLRGNLRNTIAFADSQTENKPVKEGLINGVVAFTVIG